MKLENAFVSILIVFMFVLPFSYANAGERQEIKYKNWTVDFQSEVIRYSTNGLSVNGHIFGWLVRPGACDVDVLYLSISTYKENATSLKKNLNGKTIPLKISFPEITQIPVTGCLKQALYLQRTINLCAIFVYFSYRSIILNPLRLRELKKIKIEVDRPYSDLFDITWDEYDLNGYIAAKEKAHDICEQHSIKLMALN